MPCCVAFGCSTRECDKNSSPPITVHKFPTDEAEREKWIQVLGRENWKPSKRSILCSKHFKDEDFDRTSPFVVKLKNGVVPSVFPDFPDRLMQKIIEIKPEPEELECDDLGTHEFVKSKDLTCVKIEDFTCVKSEDLTCPQDSEDIVIVKDEVEENPAFENDFILAQETPISSVPLEIPLAPGELNNHTGDNTAQQLGITPFIEYHDGGQKGPKSYYCIDCGYATTKIQRFNRHMRTHTGERPYPCSLCSFRSRDASGLKRHQRVHTGEKEERKIPCPQCDYVAINKFVLRKHMLRHTDDKPFRCSECDHRSKTSSRLKEHMKVHTGERLFQCHLCDHRTADADRLKRHVRVHTGEKPFECTECSYSTANPSNLVLHRRVHTGEKPYNCEVCDRRFANPSNLRSHMRMHRREKPKNPTEN